MFNLVIANQSAYLVWQSVYSLRREADSHASVCTGSE